MNALSRCAALVLVLVLSATSLVSCASQDPKGSVTVLAPWIGTDPGSEGYAFRRILAEFSKKTGIKVNYQETRALAQVLLSSVLGGTAPDIAVLSSPGDHAKFARAGKLLPLDDVLDVRQQNAYNRTWLLPNDGHIYTVPIKANLKSLIWFNPASGLRSAPRTWEELFDYSHAAANSGIPPWCMGMGDAPLSGWPGADLINDIFLHRFGPELYREWARGALPWTSDEVRQAWTSFGELSTDPRLVHGGPRTVVLTDFNDTGRSLFADPPGCLMEHQASFIIGFYRNYRGLPQGTPKPGTHFDFFPFPAASTPQTDRSLWDISIDLAGMFNDTPEARALMQYLATDEAQKIWPEIPGSGAFTVNRNVDPAIYGDDQISRRIAKILNSTTDTLCFSASDIMPATMRYAYYRAVLEYLSNPGQLDQLLQKLDQIRKNIGPEEWLNLACGP